MAWRPGKYLGKAIKEIGKGIKKVGRGIGKAFKKVFKGIGKFIGKLGPIGMLGMMLIMPQLGAWWGQFGTWAGNLSGPLSSVMKGVYWAGSKVGTAMTTVTEGIQKTLNVVTGGTFSTAGTANYQAGLSDNFANWMSGQLDKGREFFGLETATPIGTTPDVTDITDVVADATTVPDTTIIPDTETITAYSASDQQVIDQIKAFETKGLQTTADSLTANLSPEGLEMYKTSGTEGYIDDFGTLGEGERIVKAGDKLGERITSAIRGKDDISTWDKIVSGGEKLYEGAETLAEAQNLYASFTDDPYDIETGWNNYVADNMVGYYDSAIEDYNSLGYIGQPSWGMGSDNFFASTYNLGQTEPWLWQTYMRKT
jgi:hypothetical protein